MTESIRSLAELLLESIRTYKSVNSRVLKSFKIVLVVVVVVIIKNNELNSRILCPKKCIFVLKCTNLLLVLQQT